MTNASTEAAGSANEGQGYAVKTEAEGRGPRPKASAGMCLCVSASMSMTMLLGGIGLARRYRGHGCSECAEGGAACLQGNAPWTAFFKRSTCFVIAVDEQGPCERRVGRHQIFQGAPTFVGAPPGARRANTLILAALLDGLSRLFGRTALFLPLHYLILRKPTRFG